MRSALAKTVSHRRARGAISGTEFQTPWPHVHLPISSKVSSDAVSVAISLSGSRGLEKICVH